MMVHVASILLSLLGPMLLLVFGGYREAVPGYRYEFPRDYFNHPQFRTEWWYYTGNVFDSGGRRFGFELVFFRQGERHETDNQSAWDAQDVYLAHAALTDAPGKRFLYEERLNRAGPGIAGVSFERQRIWNGNWSVQWSDAKQTLEAVTGKFRFHLTLESETRPVIHGENGVSQKGEAVGQASHYVSLPRMKASGQIDSVDVSGTAWLDHEWFTQGLSPDEVGWDWFSVQLDDRTEIMLGDLRRKDGSIDPHSSGTWIDAQGKATHLKREDFTLEPLARWKKYPVEWRIRVPSHEVDLTVRPVLQNQELTTKAGGSYWEGAVDYSGTHRGVGYLEMTGYERFIQLSGTP
jgi:predicted secreted hydrolase